MMKIQKNYRRWIAALLLVSMFVGLLPVGVLAAETEGTTAEATSTATDYTSVIEALPEPVFTHNELRDITGLVLKDEEFGVLDGTYFFVNTDGSGHYYTIDPQLNDTSDDGDLGAVAVTLSEDGKSILNADRTIALKMEYPLC